MEERRGRKFQPFFGIAVLFCLVSMVLEVEKLINLPALYMATAGEVTNDTNENHQQTKPPGSHLNLIQIGANDGVENNVDEVTKILNNPDSKAILVEGSPSVFKLLTTNVKAKYDPTLQRIAVLNALVCEEGEKKVFYSVDVPKMMQASKTENYKLPHWVEYQLSSLEKSSIRRGVRGFLRGREGRKHFTNVTANDLIVEEMLDCVSFESIFSKASFGPGEVDVLAIDVEGFDAPVMLESFKLPGLEPNLIIFEFKITIDIFKNEFNEVMDTLSRRGYITNCEKSESGDWRCHGGQDVIARKS